MPDKDVIRTDRAPGPFQGAPYNQAIRVGDFVFVAGQIDRGYERIDERLRALGASIERADL